MDPHFVFAKTVADTPHYWVKRTPENEAGYVALYHAIRDHGVSEGLGRHQTRSLWTNRQSLLLPDPA